MVSYMLALRTELHMRIVMPAVVKHDKAPYRCMARFETGPGGNPHAHGFSMGNAGPKVARVKADVEGDGDVAPETVTDDVRGVLKVFRAAEGSEEGWSHGAEFSQEATRRFVRDVLKRNMERDLVGSEDHGVSRSDGGDESADEEQADLLHGRI